MNQLELEPETRSVLDRIRHSSKVLSIYEMPADLAEAAVWEIGKIVLADRGLAMVQENGYRWYLRELSKLLRTKTEWDLALEMEICLRKWAAYKLDPELLQTLLRECYDRIGAMTPEEVETREGARNTEARIPNDESMGKVRSSNGRPRRHESREKGSGTGTLEPLNPGALQEVASDE
jgi:hypothetical protein